MAKRAKRASVYLKMQVLGAIEAVPGNTIISRIKEVEKVPFTGEDGLKRCFTWRTIQTWYSVFKKHGGFPSELSSRADKGIPRKCQPEELLEAINQAKQHFRDGKYGPMQIYRYIIEKGLILQSQLSQTSFYRMSRQYEFFKENGEDSKMRLAFAMRYANELWQGDTMFGPFISTPTGKMQARLIAFIDDASRVVVHGEFFTEENTGSLVQALRSAFYKRGIPERLYVDNGKIYVGNEITCICARVGTVLCHTPVRDGAAKGKIERFFCTVRMQFLSRELDLSSLEALNRQFHIWVEEEYNCRVHSILGLKPIDRFNFDIKRVKFLSPTENTAELFYAEDERTVKKDNTFSFKGTRYEPPMDLREKKVKVRYDRLVMDKVIVYYNGQRVGEVRRLDPIFNGALRRNNRKEFAE